MVEAGCGRKLECAGHNLLALPPRACSRRCTQADWAASFDMKPLAPSSPLLSGLALALLCAPGHAQNRAASTYGGAVGLPHAALPPLRVPDALGTNIHFTDEKPGEAKMMAAGGYRVIRMDFGWAATEREKGVYDFAAYDRLAATLAANKLKPYFILDYGNALYSPSSKGGPATEEADTPAYRAAFAKWALAAATHFKGRGIIWEMWNEPNGGGFWKPTPDAAIYSRLALEASRAIKTALPDECVVGPATSGIDLPFIETCFKMGLLQYWDAVSVHPYRQSVPETSNAQYRELRRLIEQYKPRGKAVPVLAGEWGYSSAWGGFDEGLQGKYLPREWLTNLYNRVPVSIWYDWHEDGTDPKEPEHHFGSVRNALLTSRAEPYEPKPAYIAARALARQLDGYSFNKRLWTGREDEWVLLFSRGQQVKIAAWTSEATTQEKPTVSPRTLSLPASPGSFGVADHLGAPKPDIRAQNGRLLFAVTDSVSYISPRGPNALLLRAAQWATVPLESWVRAPYAFASDSASAQPGVLNGATRQEAVDAAPRALLRDAEPLQVISRDSRDKASSFAQVSQVTVANPLQVLAEPAEAPGSLRIRLQSNEAESGAVRVTIQGQKPLTIPYRLASGERETQLDVPGLLKGEARVAVVALDSRGRPTVRPRTLRFVALDSFSRAGADADYAAVPDGDAKVASTQSLSLAQAPEALGGKPIKALKLSYSWGEGWKFLRVLPPATLKLEGQPKYLKLWVLGDGAGNLARLRVRDESGQTFQPTGDPQSISWKGWKLVSFALDGARNTSYWGGANDGIVHGSLSWDSVFLLDGAGRAATAGAIYLANPTLVYEDEDTGK